MARNDIQLKETGERMIPEYHKTSLIYGEHVTRYLSTKPLIKNKVILDIACGSGYGCHFMAENSKKVFGVDISSEAIMYAKEYFNAPNIEYMVGNGEDIPLKDNSVDVVVTFETIEHIKNYKKFIKEIKRVLRPDGIVILSTPNDLEFAEGNHFHIHEFEYKELFNILRKDFEYIDSYYQGTWKYVGLGDSKLLSLEGAVSIETLNLAPLKPDQYLYFYLICSNRKITEKIKSIGAMSAHYSDRQQEVLSQEILRLRNALRDSKHTIEQAKELQNLTGNKLIEAKRLNQFLNTEIKSIKESKAYKLALKARAIKLKATFRSRRNS